MSRFDSKNDRPRKQAVVDDQSLNFLIMILGAILLLLLVTAAYFITVGIGQLSEGKVPGDGSSVSAGDYPFRHEIDLSPLKDAEGLSVLEPVSTSDTGIYSDFAALIDMTTGEILASRKAGRDISPASMVKVMTLIVTVENLKTADAMNEKLTIAQASVDKMAEERSSGVGFKAGESFTVKELLHALILQSDGVAALTLAEYIAGSEEAFAEMMNEKAEEIGMNNTYFGNCTGLEYNSPKSTCKDIAIMMSYAIQNPFCAEILSAKSYKLPTPLQNGTSTLWHATLATDFDNLKISAKLNTVSVKAAKSGWIGDISGNCLVTYAEGKNGHKYILVTAKALTVEGVMTGKEASLSDLINIYNTYAK